MEGFEVRLSALHAGAGRERSDAEGVSSAGQLAAAAAASVAAACGGGPLAGAMTRFEAAVGAGAAHVSDTVEHYAGAVMACADTYREVDDAPAGLLDRLYFPGQDGG